MRNKTEILLGWHRVLLSEVSTVAYRLADERDLTASFIDDLAFSLERLAERVRREMPQPKPTE